MDNNSNLKKKHIIKDGIATEALPGGDFLNVEIDGKKIIAHLSGKMRIHHIRVYPGDKVSVRMSDDGEKGIIMRRL